MKELIKTNLERLFNQNFELIKEISFEDIANELIKNNPKAYDVSTGLTRNLYEKEEIELIEKSKRNKKLVDLFESAKKKLISANQYIEGFKKDILNSIEIIKEEVGKENKGYEAQGIFLEYDYEPHAYFCGFGKGDYPILESHKYIEFNSQEQLFNGIGRISFADFWKERRAFDNQLEELEIEDMFYNSELYEKLQSAYELKTNLLLYEAFDQIPIIKFEGIPIKLPLYIFGNEHGCEAINIFIYE